MTVLVSDHKGTDGARPGPRPGLSGTIGLFDLEKLDSSGLVEQLQLVRSLIGWAEASEANVMAELDQRFRDEAQDVSGLDPRVDPDPVRKVGLELAGSLAVTEIACALRIPERTAEMRLQAGLALTSEYPDTLLDLRSGKISYQHALTIVEEAGSVPAKARAEFESALRERARSSTRAQLARFARREREKYHPETIQARRVKAAGDRSVGVEPARDGMCWFSAYLPAETGIGIENRITAMARTCQGPDEPRTLMQLRTDIFAGLLTGGTVAGSSTQHRGPASGCAGGAACRNQSIRDQSSRVGGSKSDSVAWSDPDFIEVSGPDFIGGSTGSVSDGSVLREPAGPEVLITMDAATLAGATNSPAYLEGYGPLSPDVARGLAAMARSFTPLLTDSAGNLLAMGRKSRIPSPVLRKWLRVRDETCRFVGCNRLAANAEVDHSIPWHPSGRTDHDNLAHLCKKHHRFKTKTRWNLRHEKPGWLTWTSPAGKTYYTAPALEIAPIQRGAPPPKLNSNSTADGAVPEPNPDAPASVGNRDALASSLNASSLNASSLNTDASVPMNPPPF